MDPINPPEKHRNIPPPSNWESTSRREELARLLPLWPSQLADLSLTGRRHVVQLLWRALREERRRARGGHWAYDVARHAALASSYRREQAELAACEARARAAPSSS